MLRACAEIVTESGAEINFYSLDTGVVVDRFKPPENVSTMMFTPDGSRLITAGANTIRFWDPWTGRMCASLTDHAWPIEALAMDSTMSTLVSANSRSVRLWKQGWGG